MLFHTHEFFLLLILTVLAYRVLGGVRQAVLLAGSIIFYAYAGLGMAALFLGVVLFNWICYQRIGERRGAGWLAVAIAVDLLNLFTFKYTSFALGILIGFGADLESARTLAQESLILPVGISFYTFQLIALLVDCYRGDSERASTPLEFMLFVTFMGQLVAGPIMRGREFLPQLKNLQLPDAHQTASGLVWFSIGLIKKVVLADYLLAGRVDALFAGATTWDAPTSWFLGILFGFQIYFDFSGYCDMAVGIGRFFGLDLRINFSTPYVSRSPSEFWSRWNITLSRWFGDYVYIPLGGSRVPLGRTVINLLLTMLISGLWHGAGFTFIVWGGIHGVALAGWHAARKALPVLGHHADRAHLAPATALLWAFTTAVTIIGWVYFRADSLSQSNQVVAAMFGFGEGTVRGPVTDYTVLSFALLGLHFAEWRFWYAAPALTDRALAFWRSLPGPLQACLLAPAVIALIALTKETKGAFIYFQF